MTETDDDTFQPPTKEQVAKYEMLLPMLDSAIAEMREFSKKKQDGVVNKTKINILNRLLRDIKEILSTEPTDQYLDLLDEEMMPQNSDAVLILGQYRAAMDRFKEQHFRRPYPGTNLQWMTEDMYEYSDDEDDEGDEDAEDDDEAGEVEDDDGDVGDVVEDDDNESNHQ
jgi:hypothetical protein